MQPVRLLLALCAALLSGEPAHSTALSQRETIGDAIDGVWRSQGYGWIIVLSQGVPALYHAAGPYCYRDPDPDAGEDEPFRLVTIVHQNRIAFATGAAETRYVFNRIAALPPACLAEQRWSPAETGRLIAATFADLYPGFGHRGRTQEALAAALATLPPDATEAALYDRLEPALAALDDAHVGVEAIVGGEERSFESGEAPSILAIRGDSSLGADPAARERQWSQRYRESLSALLEGGGHQVANRRVLWGTIGRVGYINIVTMGAFASEGPPEDTAALDAALDEALTAFSNLPGVIVDVSNNRGGYDAISLRIAGRFTDQPRLAFTKQAAGSDVPFQRFLVEPSDRVRYLGPVTLLTSDITVSAGETFTLAMRSLPNVRHAGGRTRGALSDQLSKPLPNGWTLTLPAETYRAADGREYEGVGITPNFPTAPLGPDHAATVSVIAKHMAEVPAQAPLPFSPASP